MNPFGEGAADPRPGPCRTKTMADGDGSETRFTTEEFELTRSGGGAAWNLPCWPWPAGNPAGPGHWAWSIEA